MKSIGKRFMVGTRWRLAIPTRAVHAPQDGDKTIVVVPEGAVLTVHGYFDNERVLTVEYEGKELIMFLQDLQQRGEPKSE